MRLLFLVGKTVCEPGPWGLCLKMTLGLVPLLCKVGFLRIINLAFDSAL